MDNEYIVYAAFDKDGNCLYVGQGKQDRYRHITSGVSHVYEANKWHFANKYIKVDILHSNLTKQDAVTKEKMEIERLTPAWNRCEYNNPQISKMYSFITKRMREFVKDNPRYRGRFDYNLTIAKDLCKLLNRGGETIIVKGQKWFSGDLPVGFMSHLACESGKYYQPLRYIFDVVKNEQNCYVVKLKGWFKNDLLPDIFIDLCKEFDN